MGALADAVEGVRAAIARYTLALDDGRTDDVVATFCADGGCDIPGLGAFEGHDALRAGFGSWQPKIPVRHLVSNTLVEVQSENEATAISDVVVLVERDDRWMVQVVGRYHDTLHRDGNTWRFHHRAARFVR